MRPVYLTAVALVLGPCTLCAQGDVRVGAAVGVQSRSSTAGGRLAVPTVQASFGYGLTRNFDIGAVIGFSQPTQAGLADGMSFRSLHLEPRLVVMRDTWFSPFLGARLGYTQQSHAMPLAGRRMTAGGFAFGALGGAAIRATRNVALEFGGTVSKTDYVGSAMVPAPNERLSFGIYLGTSIRLQLPQ